MSTRTELIEQLKNLDTSKLQKLVALSEVLLLPDRDALLQVTSADMISKAKALADIHFPEWTDKSESDFGMFLVEIFALFSWKDFFYANIFSSEFSEYKAKLYKSVYLRAKAKGYLPTHFASGECSIRVRFENVPVGGYSLKQGDIEISVSGATLFLTNLELAPLNVPEGTSTHTLTFATGRFSVITGTFIGRPVRLSGKGLSVKHLNTISVNGNVWTKVDDFSNSTADSNHFMLLPSDGDDYEIVFGDGRYGKIPEYESIVTVSVLLDTSELADRNIAITNELFLSKDASTKVATIEMLSAVTGAGNKEDIESIRNKSSIYFRTLNTSIKNSDDVKILLEKQPEVRQATAFNLFNTFYFAVVRENGVDADNTFITLMRDRLLPLMPDNFEIEGSVANNVVISSIVVDVSHYDDFESEIVSDNVKDYIEFITDPMGGARFGVGIDLGSASETIIGSVSGVTNVVFKTINGQPAVNISLTAFQIFRKIVRANITVNTIRINN